MTANIVDGPRGRRFLYELLCLAEERNHGGYEENSLAAVVWDMSIRLTKDDGSVSVLTFEWPDADSGHGKGGLAGLVGRMADKLAPRFGSLLSRFEQFRGKPTFGWAAYAPNAGSTSGSSVNTVPHWKKGVPPGRDLATSAKVAMLIKEASKLLAEDEIPTRDLVRALAESVTWARYWQEPDTTDLILSDQVIVEALADVEELLEALGVDLEALAGGESELLVTWGIEGANAPHESKPSDQILDEWLVAKLAGVERAEKLREDDPTVNWSGIWWSRPPHELWSSNGTIPSGEPAGLHFVEDGPVSDHAEVRELSVPDKRVLVIDSDDDWAGLCARFPLDITAEVRHDWYRVTGTNRTWIIPNWRDAAGEWDGITLSVRGYLSAATRAINVGDRASMIAGWNPGETYWLGGEGIQSINSSQWRTADQSDLSWERVSGER